MGTISGDIALTAASANLLKISPAVASRNVELPAPTSCEGLFFVIANGAALSSGFKLALNHDGSTIVLVDEQGLVIVGSDGTNWIYFADHVSA